MDDLYQWNDRERSQLTSKEISNEWKQGGDELDHTLSTLDHVSQDSLPPMITSNLTLTLMLILEMISKHLLKSTIQMGLNEEWIQVSWCSLLFSSWILISDIGCRLPSGLGLRSWGKRNMQMMRILRLNSDWWRWEGGGLEIFTTMKMCRMPRDPTHLSLWWSRMRPPRASDELMEDDCLDIDFPFIPSSSSKPFPCRCRSSPWATQSIFNIIHSNIVHTQEPAPNPDHHPRLIR